VLIAPHQAYDLLAPCYPGDGMVEVRRIPGLRFHYTAGHRLDHLGTAVGTAAYLRRLPALVEHLCREMHALEPDLVITDLDPALPRAAERLGVPYLSLDHQHFLLTSDLRSLRPVLRWHAAFMGSLVKLYYRRQVHTVVSSFYFPPLLPGLQNVTQIGVLLRPEIRYAEPRRGNYLLAYLRRDVTPSVLGALADCGCEVRIYGLGERASRGRLRFRGVDIHRFAEDLAGCRGLVSTAGNQLLGEALYLGKPVLAMPEAGNREQEINAHFLSATGGGETADLESLDARRLRTFLERGGQLAHTTLRQRLCGNPEALAVIHRHLGEPLPGSLPSVA
jgi:uncharacterized protein (TIGR00661 family)